MDLRLSNSNSEVTERAARIATIVNEGGTIYLVLGEGDHTSDRWLLSESLVRKLVSEGFNIAMKPR